MAKSEADRQLAGMVTNGRPGFTFTVSKLLLRAYRFSRRAGLRAGLLRGDAAQPTKNVDRRTVLISNQLLVGEKLAAVCAGPDN
ncbi:MAG: glycosyl transferase family 1, partial [Mesorhizobium sp.]